MFSRLTSTITQYPTNIWMSEWVRERVSKWENKIRWKKAQFRHIFFRFSFLVFLEKSNTRKFASVIMYEILQNKYKNKAMEGIGRLLCVVWRKWLILRLFEFLPLMFLNLLLILILNQELCYFQSLLLILLLPSSNFISLLAYRFAFILLSCDEAILFKSFQ